ncbi:MAG: hypothetical protein OQJ97_07660 [Rhodospirillales bacterium]|nr:hypothetical protein [Rhodospirillales bacterium]
MDAAALLDIYDEAHDEAISRGVDGEMAHNEAITAASMMLAAMEGVEDEEARHQIEELIAEQG